MRPARASSVRPAAAADVTAADTAAGAKVASEEATSFRNQGVQERFGQGWIRTSEGVKPADLQSAPFGHFGTYPSGARDFIYPRARSLQLASAFTVVDPRFRATTLLRWGFCVAFFGLACSSC